MKKFIIVILFYMIINTFICSYDFPIEKDLYFFGRMNWQTLGKHGNVLYYDRACYSKVKKSDWKSYNVTFDMNTIQLDKDGWYKKNCLEIIISLYLEEIILSFMIQIKLPIHFLLMINQYLRMKKLKKNRITFITLKN